MYKRTTINESVQPRFLDIEEFMTYTSLGRTSAMRLGKEIGFGIIGTYTKIMLW